MNESNPRIKSSGRSFRSEISFSDAGGEGGHDDHRNIHLIEGENSK